MQRIYNTYRMPQRASGGVSEWVSEDDDDEDEKRTYKRYRLFDVSLELEFGNSKKQFIM